MLYVIMFVLVILIGVNRLNQKELEGRIEDLEEEVYLCNCEDIDDLSFEDWMEQSGRFNLKPESKEPIKNKFKVGDYVEAINDEDEESSMGRIYIKKGDKGIVQEDSFCPYVIWDKDNRRYAENEKNLKLVKKPVKTQTKKITKKVNKKKK